MAKKKKTAIRKFVKRVHKRAAKQAVKPKAITLSLGNNINITLDFIDKSATFVGWGRPVERDSGRPFDVAMDMLSTVLVALMGAGVDLSANARLQNAMFVISDYILNHFGDDTVKSKDTVSRSDLVIKAATRLLTGLLRKDFNGCTYYDGIQGDAEKELGHALLLPADSPPPVGLDLTVLQYANYRRSRQWDPRNKITLLFHSNELAGEAGEAANVVKKMEREAMGLPGSRATTQDLGSELADVVICASLTANKAGIDLPTAVIKKFNETSREKGFTIFLPDPTPEPVPEPLSGPKTSQIICDHVWHAYPELLPPCPKCGLERTRG